MDYIDLVGSLPEAMELVLTKGGRLYQGKYKDSCHTVVIGKDCYTFWNKNSKKRQELKLLCDEFNVSSKGQTGGRLARWVLRELVELPHKGTYWDRNYRAIAKSGLHWHYTYVNPNKYYYAVEFDLKSAYFSSLFAAKSFLYQTNIGSMNDNGSLQRLKELTPMFPKWFRLQILGIIASWKVDYWIRTKGSNTESELIRKTNFLITYGAAFNAVHRAIIRNYKIMQKVHKIGGKHIERMHTDSFLLNLECPESIEKDIFNYLEEKGALIDVKSAGLAYFFDLNTGVVGRSFIGSKIDVIGKLREHQVKISREGGYKIAMTKYEQQLQFREKIEALAKDKEREQESPYKQLEIIMGLQDNC